MYIIVIIIFPVKEQSINKLNNLLTSQYKGKLY